ncbi:hypothetical protein HGRIS_013766 [Hohenbuehelia grisea]|uniref:Uncharacterized protein n=1 Tax=Hohenbuehelia grisea TaxID=104357 RepID=A0ABR3IWK8_9AGAR
MKEGLDWTFHIDIYRADDYSGTITESDEMLPVWFNVPARHAIAEVTASPSGFGDHPTYVPYHKMWGSDVHWLPFVISRQFFMGRTSFSADNSLLRWWFGVARSSSL